jgi:hypothetical protein
MQTHAWGGGAERWNRKKGGTERKVEQKGSHNPEEEGED